MKAFRRLISISIMLIMGCSSGLEIVYLGQDPTTPWQEPYVDGMNGAENLVFDGEGFLYVTGLDGIIYKIAPTDDPFRGNIVDSKNIGKLCLGIEVGPDNMLYVGVIDKKGDYKIAKLSKDFSEVTFLTDNIPGLNGFDVDKSGYLYYTSSNHNPIFPKGKIYRVKLGNDENFKNPEIIVDNAGIVNGLAFSPDESILYYTETLNGVWAFDLKTNEKKQIYSPKGFFQVVDDLTVAEDRTIWVCSNSEKALVPIRNNIIDVEYRIGDLGAPSSCEFGKGPGFNPDFLYITEFGLTGRNLKMNGRGVWVFPVGDLGK